MRPPESMSPNNKSIRFLPDALPRESWERTGEGEISASASRLKGEDHGIPSEREEQLYEAIHHRINGTAAQNSHPRSRWIGVGGAVNHGRLALLLTLWSFTLAREKAVGKVISLPLHGRPLFKCLLFAVLLHKAVGYNFTWAMDVVVW